MYNVTPEKSRLRRYPLQCTDKYTHLCSSSSEGVHILTEEKLRQENNEQVTWKWRSPEILWSAITTTIKICQTMAWTLAYTQTSHWSRLQIPSCFTAKSVVHHNMIKPFKGTGRFNDENIWSACGAARSARQTFQIHAWLIYSCLILVIRQNYPRPINLLLDNSQSPHHEREVKLED